MVIAGLGFAAWTTCSNDQTSEAHAEPEPVASVFFALERNRKNVSHIDSGIPTPLSAIVMMALERRMSPAYIEIPGMR